MSSHVLHCETQFVDEADMSGILPIEKLSNVWLPENRAVCHAWVNQKQSQKNVTVFETYSDRNLNNNVI